MSIFSLRQCADKESSSVGKKAYWLGQMVKENENEKFVYFLILLQYISHCIT